MFCSSCLGHVGLTSRLKIFLFKRKPGSDVDGTGSEQDVLSCGIVSFSNATSYTDSGAGMECNGLVEVAKAVEAGGAGVAGGACARDKEQQSDSDSDASFKTDGSFSFVGGVFKKAKKTVDIIEGEANELAKRCHFVR